MLQQRALALAILATAVTAVPARAAPLATNLSDVTTFPAPPAGFDPIRAADQDLRTYGFPARPNPFHAPRAYAAWSRMVGAARIRITPVLQRTAVRHRPMMLAPRPAGAPLSSHTSYSTNWSGEVLTGPATSFGPNSFYALWGEFNIPVGEQQYGVCTGGTEYSATWIGMDGSPGAAPDVVQAGTESDAACYNGTTYPSYYAWYEWYPGYTVNIANFPVLPGQDIAVEVGVGSATSASVFMTNETTNQYVAIAFSAPAGTNFVGNSAEWIVERPEIDGVVRSLANYVAQFFADTFSVVHPGVGTAVWGGQGAAGYPTTDVTMLQSNNPVSVATTIGIDALQLHTVGPAK
jgi:hypothetical protein